MTDAAPDAIDPTVTGTDHVHQNLTDALNTVTTEISSTDSKASLLLAFNGAVIAGLAGAVDKDLPLSCPASPAEPRSSRWPRPPFSSSWWCARAYAAAFLSSTGRNWIRRG